MIGAGVIVKVFAFAEALELGAAATSRAFDAGSINRIISCFIN